MSGAQAFRAALLALAVAWLLAAAATARAGRWRLAGAASVVAVANGAAAAAVAAAPVLLATWLGYGLALPDAALRSRSRRVVAGIGATALVGWTASLVAAGSTPGPYPTAAAAMAVTAVAVIGAALRCRRAGEHDRGVLHWLAAALLLAVAADAVLLALAVLAGVPTEPGHWLLVPLLLVPLAQIGAVLVRSPRVAHTILVESIVVAGMAGLVVTVFLVVVVGLGRRPVGTERDVLLSSVAASIAVAALALPVRHRLVELAGALTGAGAPAVEDTLTTFGARMTRAVPMDELMLQLAESLRATLAPAGAELWIGTSGLLDRTVSVPTRPPMRLALGERERVVVGQARLGGPSWSAVWLPGLPEATGDLRVAPVTHLGDLLGLIVARRDPGAPPFTEDDERLLVELARQLGLALHNVRLDSALQKSLAELQERNAELQASRLRIVAAADESRRAIERNLHDGAQQHLVALAVRLSLAGQIAAEEPDQVPELLAELRGDVKATIEELRELAHGIYPPLLRDGGLGEALSAAVRRSRLTGTATVDLPGRYAQEVETAAYFCCLEAMQNAGKHAGDAATLTVQVRSDADILWFQVADEGVGFDAGPVATGHGFVNMRDRLGALGGDLEVVSHPGAGTTVTGRIPARALAVQDERAAR